MLLETHDKLLFIGDSVTDVDRARPVGQGLAFGLGHGYPLLVNAQLALRFPQLHVEVLNLGASGNTTRDLLARWESDVLAHKPSVVSILIGINDVWRQFDCPGRKDQVTVDEYAANLRTLIASTLPEVKAILLLTPFFLELHADDPMRSMTDEYAAVCRAVAEENERVWLVDTQAAFDQLLARRHYMTIAGDRVHPNTTGHLLISELVTDMLATAELVTGENTVRAGQHP